MSASATTGGVIGRYTSALFDLANESNALSDVANDLGKLGRVIDGNADLKNMIESPVIGREEQTKAMSALGERLGLNKLVGNFVGLLASKRRLFALPAMIDAFTAMVRDHSGIMTARVVSAQLLTDEQRTEIQGLAGSHLGQSVELETEVDPELIDGFVLYLGSRMIDASLRTKLNALENSLKGVG